MKPAEQTPLSALYMAALSKGQEISKRNFGVFKSSKNEWNLFKDFFFWFDLFLKVAFFSESVIRFLNLPISKKKYIPKNYLELEI